MSLIALTQTGKVRKGLDPNYINSSLNINPSDTGSFNMDRLDLWMENLYAIRHYDEAIKSFSFEMYKHLSQSKSSLEGGHGILFFKYLKSYSSLLVTHSEGINFSKVRGLGLNFSKNKDFLPERDILGLSTNGSFSELLEKVLPNSPYSLQPLYVRGEVRGLFVFIHIEEKHLQSPFVQVATKVLSHWLSEILLIDTQHDLLWQDELTGLLNKKIFYECVFREVRRAQEIFHPVSLMQTSIDNFERIRKEFNPDQVQTLLKKVAQVLKQSVRAIDPVGRLSEKEMAILFPHMGIQALRRKALEIKHSLENARYFKDSPDFIFNLRVTLSICEYPTTASDAEDMFLSTSQRLLVEEDSSQIYEVDKGSHFIPDFEVVRGMKESSLKEAILCIDSEALKLNFDWFKKQTQSSFVCPMIKANAYGLGDLLVYDILSEHGATHFGVARLSEALNLRKFEQKKIGSIKSSPEILLFNAFNENDLDRMFKYKITPVVSSWEQMRCLKTFLELNPPSSDPHRIHLELDVGMNRLGLKEGDLESVLGELLELQGRVLVEGLFSHFSHAEDWGEAYGVSQEEEKKFQKMVDQCMKVFEAQKPIKADPFFIHLPSSRAFDSKDISEIKIPVSYGIRPGIGLYGLGFQSKNQSENQK